MIFVAFHDVMKCDELCLCQDKEMDGHVCVLRVSVFLRFVRQYVFCLFSILCNIAISNIC
jgi:hypothetical protein